MDEANLSIVWSIEEIISLGTPKRATSRVGKAAGVSNETFRKAIPAYMLETGGICNTRLQLANLGLLFRKKIQRF